MFEDIVYCSAGYGVGAGAFKLSKKGSKLSAEQIWRRENECFNHWSTPVVKDGYLYGMFSFKEYGAGPLACVDIRTGKDAWKKEGFGPGQVILADKTIIAISDKGELVFVDADVVLEPFAVRAVVSTLRAADVGLVAPYPFQEAGTWLERLVQPLVQPLVPRMAGSADDDESRDDRNDCNGCPCNGEGRAEITTCGHWGPGHERLPVRRRG